MKVLFDNNLSYKLCHKLADLFPGSQHVSDARLESASDHEVWAYAKQNDFIIISKDEDFSYLSQTFGFPPKVIWLKIGNLKTLQIENLIRTHHQALTSLLDEKIGLIEVES